METSGETSKTSEAKAAFNRACARLMVFGATTDLTVPGVPPALGVIKQSARRMWGAWAKLFGDGQTPDGKTIEAWATKSVPHPEAFGRLCQVIFGAAHDGHETYRAFDALWKAARAKPASAEQATTPPAGIGFRDLEWTPRSQDQPDGLLELRAHRPMFSNEDPDTARLPVTLSFDQIHDTVTHRKQRFDLRLGLSRAELRPEWVNCQPGFRSRPGQNAEKPSTGHVQVRAGVFHISGPLRDGTVLVGDPFDGDPACSLEPTGAGEPRVTLTLTSTVNDVDVTITRGGTEAEAMKEKLVKAWLLARATKVEDGRTVVWGKATLRGRKRT